MEVSRLGTRFIGNPKRTNAPTTNHCESSRLALLARLGTCTLRVDSCCEQDIINFCGVIYLVVYVLQVEMLFELGLEKK